MTALAFLARRRAFAVALSLLPALGANVALAQGAYPEKPITWLVGFAPGGSADVVTRLVARKLEQALGQSVVVENRPGASGAISLNATAKAAPDGYTLVTVAGPVLTNVPVSQLGAELTGVATLGKGPMVLVGTPGAGAPADLKSLLASLQAAPSRYSFASAGNGTSQHLAGELINQMAGVKMTHVPYKGGNQAVLDVLAGRVPLALLGVAPVLAHIKAGKLKAYGVSSVVRDPTLPDVPTLQEAGLGGFEATQWYVVAAPTGTPGDRIQKLNTAIAAILKQPDLAEGFAGAGISAAVQTPQQTTEYVAGDLKRWRDLAQKLKLTLD